MILEPFDKLFDLIGIACVIACAKTIFYIIKNRKKEDKYRNHFILSFFMHDFPPVVSAVVLAISIVSSLLKS